MAGVCGSGHLIPSPLPAVAEEVRNRERRLGAATGMWLALIVLALVVIPSEGCAVQEVRGKSAFGPEYRHSGTRNENEVRYNAVQGLELRWDKGITTGVSYRRRDSSEGSGDNDNLVLFEVGYPLWKAPKKEDALAKRIEQLERQVKELQSGVRSGASNRTPVPAMDGEYLAAATSVREASPSTKENDE